MPWLENLLHTIGESPLFLSIGALILFILLLSAVLRVAKLALFAFLLLTAYVGYLHYTGGDVPREVRKAEKVIERSARKAGRVIKDNAKVAGEAVQNAAENVGERLEQGLNSSTTDDGSAQPKDKKSRGGSRSESSLRDLRGEPDSRGSPPEHP